MNGLITIDVCDFAKFECFDKKSDNIRNFLRIIYVDGCYKISSNDFFLTYPQVSLSSSSIEIVYLRVIFKNEIDIMYEYEIRRSKCTAIKINNEIFIQDEITMFSISEKCAELIVKNFNIISRNNHSLTNLRRIILNKKLSNVIHFTEEVSSLNTFDKEKCLYEKQALKSIFQLEINIISSTIILMQKQSSIFDLKPNINYFAKRDIKDYLNFLKITGLIIDIERKNAGNYDVNDFKLYNILTRIEDQKQKNKVKIVFNASKTENFQECDVETKHHFEQA